MSSDELKDRKYDFAIKNPNALIDTDDRSLEEVFSEMKSASTEINNTLADLMNIIGG